MENKVVLVKAHFAMEYEEVSRRVPSGRYEKGLFSQKPIMKTVTEQVEKGISKSKIDSKRLASDLQDAINDLNVQGYKIRQILPVISGDYNYLYSNEGISSSYSMFTGNEEISGGASFGLGYGYSFTDSLIIVAEKET